MKSLEIFHIDYCPYCDKAEKAIAELTGQDKAYAAVTVNWINENREPELATGRNYYYVPTIYCGEEKLFEAHPGDSYEKIRDAVKAAFDYALAAL